MQLVLPSNVWVARPQNIKCATNSRAAAFSRPLNQVMPGRKNLILRASAPSEAVAETQEEKPFMDELRAYAMKLHTRDQAPREGKAEAPKNQPPWTPTKEGYLNFLTESKAVYNAFEDIIATQPQYKAFVGTGLERSAALEKDIAHMNEQWGLTAPPAAADGPGNSYGTFLRALAVESPPAFVCHYYNFYFAHTAGGRMIGAQVSKAALDGWMGEFYKWDGDVKTLLGGVREKLNGMAEGWSREEKDRCLQETPNTFQYSGSLLKLIAGGGGGGH